MYERKLYGHAALCFEKSGDKLRQLQCEAIHLATQASSDMSEDSHTAKSKFAQAADKFMGMFFTILDVHVISNSHSIFCGK